MTDKQPREQHEAGIKSSPSGWRIIQGILVEAKDVFAVNDSLLPGNELVVDLATNLCVPV